MLITSHILDELSRLATHYGFIDHGHMVKEISAEELEAACARKIRVKVSDMAAFSKGWNIKESIIGLFRILKQIFSVRLRFLNWSRL